MTQPKDGAAMTTTKRVTMRSRDEDKDEGRWLMNIVIIALLHVRRIVSFSSGRHNRMFFGRVSQVKKY